MFAQGEPAEARAVAPSRRASSRWDRGRPRRGRVPFGDDRARRGARPLAGALVDGLAAFGHRVADPLAVRLRELGLEAQAKLLDGLVAHTDPFDRVDDFVRLYQVLSTALLRLAVRRCPIDRRRRSRRVPTYESCLRGAGADEALVPAGEIAAAGRAPPARSTATRRPSSRLRVSTLRCSADGVDLGARRRALGRRDRGAVRGPRARGATRRARGRGPLARRDWRADVEGDGGLSATTIASDDARAMLGRVTRSGMTRPATSARRPRDRSRSPAGTRRRSPRGATTAPPFVALPVDFELANSADERASVIREILAAGDLRAVPIFRRIAAADPSRGVREEATAALAILADPELVDTMLQCALAERGDKDLGGDERPRRRCWYLATRAPRPSSALRSSRASSPASSATRSAPSGRPPSRRSRRRPPRSRSSRSERWSARSSSGPGRAVVAVELNLVPEPSRLSFAAKLNWSAHSPQA